MFGPSFNWWRPPLGIFLEMEDVAAVVDNEDVTDHMALLIHMDMGYHNTSPFLVEPFSVYVKHHQHPSEKLLVLP